MKQYLAILLEYQNASIYWKDLIISKISKKESW